MLPMPSLPEAGGPRNQQDELSVSRSDSRPGARPGRALIQKSQGDVQAAAVVAGSVAHLKVDVRFARDCDIAARPSAAAKHEILNLKSQTQVIEHRAVVA